MSITGEGKQVFCRFLTFVRNDKRGAFERKAGVHIRCSVLPLRAMLRRADSAGNALLACGYEDLALRAIKTEACGGRECRCAGLNSVRSFPALYMWILERKLLQSFCTVALTTP
jgi:hypothetical protein